MQLSSSTLKDLARLMVIWKSNSLSQTFTILWFGPKNVYIMEGHWKKDTTWHGYICRILLIFRPCVYQHSGKISVHMKWHTLSFGSFNHLFAIIQSLPMDGNLGTQTHNSVCFTIPSEEQVYQFLQLINLKWQAVTIPATCLLWLSVLWCHFVLTSCSHISTKLTEMVCHCDHNTH